jgi:hypothetical protein
MAARNTDVPLTARDEWFQITDNIVSALRVQNRITGHSVLLQATTGTTAPTSTVGAIELRSHQVWLADTPLSVAFPGVIATGGHVWALCEGNTGVVSVSHVG